MLSKKGGGAPFKRQILIGLNQSCNPIPLRQDWLERPCDHVLANETNARLFLGLPGKGFPHSSNNRDE